MILNEISLSTINWIIGQASGDSDKLNTFFNSLKGEREYQHINAGYTKIIIRNISEHINHIVVDFKNNKIASLYFQGNISVTPDELLQKFGQYREFFSVRDDLYFYFFNENRRLGNCQISFYEPSGTRIPIKENSNRLLNISILCCD